MSGVDADERDLKMAQLRADVVNKDADTEYKRVLTKSEPFKAFAAILGATAAIVAGVFGALGYILGRGH
jgi:hypothetical protein